MSFAFPLLLALVLGLVPILWLGNRRRKTVGHTQVDIHKNVRSTPVIGWLPTILTAAFWILLCVGIAGPRLPTHEDRSFQDARDWVIMVDTSGSMNTALQDKDQADFTGDPAATQTPAPGQPAAERKPPTRANGARKGVKFFVDARAAGSEGDRLALLLFDDQVYDACLFTTDMRIMSKKLTMIDGYNGGGTNFEGPVEGNSYSKTGAIQGAVDYFDLEGKSKTKVLIMVTDGEDSISPKRMAQLTQQIQDRNIHMYVLGVGESWTKGQMTDLRKFTEGVNGKVFTIGDAPAMRAAFDEINKLEKSQIVVERTNGFFPIHWYFLIAAAIALMLRGVVALIVREED